MRVRLVANSHNARLFLTDDAAVVLLPGHAVDDVLLHLLPLLQLLPPVPRAHQVELVILPREVSLQTKQLEN